MADAHEKAYVQLRALASRHQQADSSRKRIIESRMRTVIRMAGISRVDAAIALGRVAALVQ